MKILLATDGSRHSELAAKTLIALKPPSDAEVFIMHVMESPHYLITPVVPPPYNVEWHRVQHELQVEAEEAATLAVEQAEQIVTNTGLGIHSIVGEGYPANEIIDKAKEIGADLTVVGSRGLTASALFMLGSVSQKVIKYAPCSVLLTKPAMQPDEPRVARVILATDGSENAKEAARFLSSFQLADDAEIILLNVVHQLRGISRSAQSTMEQIRQSRLEDSQRLLQDTQNYLNTGAKVTTSIREGDPTEQILQASSEKNADLIVVGSKGLSGIKMFLLGSVSQRVCRYSDRSVLLVKMRHESPSSSEGHL